MRKHRGVYELCFLSSLTLHTHFLQTHTASLHCDGNRFLCGRGEGMPQTWMRVLISLPCKNIPTTCPYHLYFNYKFSEERDHGWIRVQNQLLHYHLKKAIQWPLLCPWSWDHIVSNFQGEIALICVNRGLKGWVFFSNLSHFLPLPAPLLGVKNKFIWLSERKQYRLFEKIPAVTRRRCRTWNDF